jgi:hypothetical protein
MPHMPLYVVEALCVELAALAISPRRGYLFGAFSGALIGSVGMLAEYGWSHVWMPTPWPEGLISEAIIPTLVAGIAAGIVGAYLGGSFAAAASRRPRSAPPGMLPAALATVAIVAAVGLNVGDATPSGWSARVALTDVRTGPERTVDATVRLDPPAVADDAFWLQAISWQGGGLVVDQLEQVSPGVYETTKPLPVHGTWKTLIRLHTDNYVAGLPVYLPEDSAIPAPAVKALASFDRPFTDETQILQRELKSGVPGYLAGVAYAVVGLIVLSLLVLLGWVLNRIASSDEQRPRRRRSRAPRARSGEVPA